MMGANLCASPWICVDNKVNVRSGPSTSAAVVASLNAGDNLMIIGKADKPVKLGSSTDYWF